MPMNTDALIIDRVYVSIADTPVLSNVSLCIPQGTVHVIMGKNGSGKSSLARTVMGDPACIVTAGRLSYKGQDLTALSVDKRACQGLFLSFQNPCILPGVSVGTLLKEAYQTQHTRHRSVSEFKEYVMQHLLFLGMDRSLYDRNVNEGFSGGEKKKLELLQLLVLQPTYVMLDEIDSGLDIDALQLVTQTIDKLRSDNPATSVMLITHNPHLLESIVPDAVHIMSSGTITHSGDISLLSTLLQGGYNAFTPHD